MNKAIEKLRGKLEDNPNDALTWNALGGQYRRVKDYGEAKKCFTKSLEIDSGMHIAMGNLALVSIEEEEYDKAFEYAKKTTEMKESYPNGWNFLGKAAMGKKDYQLAVDAYTKSVELKPDKVATTGLMEAKEALESM